MVSWPVPALLVLLSLGAGLAIDHDRDGASGWQELRAGTGLVRGDTDGDGLPDGYERDSGLPPLEPDADDDGLPDGEEVDLRSDPHSGDTDGDGIPDALEPPMDCDGDGVPAVASSDDDGDGRPDGLEPVGHRCDPDVDGDGVPDGDEAREDCVTAPDCDLDGLDDGLERELGYDPLDPDTFRTGLPDATAYAFERGGQAPGADADGDGIPDPWEEGGGLIDWDGLEPAAGRRDLLVEYLRVVGPDTERYLHLDLSPSYEAVAQLFEREGGITVTWTETVVTLPEEARPDILTPDSVGHYLAVLDGGRHTDNPFVTSVVLNPQQQQQHAGHVLGAAFLRSMIATADYGAHTDLHFRNKDLGPLTISPVVESHIVTNDEAKVHALGFDRGGLRNDGSIFLRDDDGQVFGAPSTLTWTPDWFARTLVLHTDDFGPFPFSRTGGQVRTGELAATVLHELGHTLGLCHAHDASCYAAFSAEDRQARHQSTMSYGSGADALHLLPSEWTGVRDYLRCPPQETVQRVADGAPADALREAKYQTSFTGPSDQRVCGDLVALEPEFATAEPTLHRSDLPQPEPVRHGGGWLALHLGLTAVAAAAALLLRRR